MKKSSKIVFVKIFLLIVTLFLTSVLFFVENNKQVQQSFVFVVDISLSMNAKDINGSLLGNGEVKFNTRLDLVKQYINKFVEKNDNVSVGLILLGDNVEYFLPATTDIETFLLYVDNLHATKQSSGINIDNLIKLLDKENQQLFIFSDMDFENIIFEDKVGKKSKIMWFGVGNSKFVPERFADGVYVDGRETRRNDDIGKKLSKELVGEYFILDEFSDIEKYSFVVDNLVSFSSERKLWYFVLVFILVLLV